MTRANYQELLDAGVHFGHLKRKWNPNMAPYIFMERNGIHIIDLHKTIAKVEEAASALKQMAKSGKKIMFVATKKQAKSIIAKKVENLNMPYVTERWPGGMLTNFATIRKAVRKMVSIDKMRVDGTFDTLSKKERLLLTRKKQKLEKLLGTIADLTRLPAALFIVDIKKEHIAVEEARKLNIPIFAIVDTNSDPNLVDYPIPANDDASQSVEKIIDIMVGAISEGLNERRADREQQALEAAKQQEKEAAQAKEKEAAKAELEKEAKKEEASEKEAAGGKEKESKEAKAEAKPAGKTATAAEKSTTGKTPDAGKQEEKPAAKKAAAKKEPAKKGATKKEVKKETKKTSEKAK